MSLAWSLETAKQAVEELGWRTGYELDKQYLLICGALEASHTAQEYFVKAGLPRRITEHLSDSQCVGVKRILLLKLLTLLSRDANVARAIAVDHGVLLTCLLNMHDLTTDPVTLEVCAHCCHLLSIFCSDEVTIKAVAHSVDNPQPDSASQASSVHLSIPGSLPSKASTTNSNNPDDNLFFGLLRFTVVMAPSTVPFVEESVRAALQATHRLVKLVPSFAEIVGACPMNQRHLAYLTTAEVCKRRLDWRRAVWGICRYVERQRLVSDELIIALYGNLFDAARGESLKKANGTESDQFPVIYSEGLVDLCETFTSLASRRPVTLNPLVDSCDCSFPLLARCWARGGTFQLSVACLRTAAAFLSPGVNDTTRLHAGAVLHSAVETYWSTVPEIRGQLCALLDSVNAPAELPVEVVRVIVSSIANQRTKDEYSEQYAHIVLKLTVEDSKRMHALGELDRKFLSDDLCDFLEMVEAAVADLQVAMGQADGSTSSSSRRISAQSPGYSAGALSIIAELISKLVAVPFFTVRPELVLCVWRAFRRTALSGTSDDAERAALAGLAMTRLALLDYTAVVRYLVEGAPTKPAEFLPCPLPTTLFEEGLQKKLAIDCAPEAASAHGRRALILLPACTAFLGLSGNGKPSKAILDLLDDVNSTKSTIAITPSFVLEVWENILAESAVSDAPEAVATVALVLSAPGNFSAPEIPTRLTSVNSEIVTELLPLETGSKAPTGKRQSITFNLDLSDVYRLFAVAKSTEFLLKNKGQDRLAQVQFGERERLFKGLINVVPSLLLAVMGTAQVDDILARSSQMLLMEIVTVLAIATTPGVSPACVHSIGALRMGDSLRPVLEGLGGRSDTHTCRKEGGELLGQCLACMHPDAVELSSQLVMNSIEGSWFGESMFMALETLLWEGLIFSLTDKAASMLLKIVSSPMARQWLSAPPMRSVSRLLEVIDVQPFKLVKKDTVLKLKEALKSLK